MEILCTTGMRKIDGKWPCRKLPPDWEVDEELSHGGFPQGVDLLSIQEELQGILLSPGSDSR